MVCFWPLFGSCTQSNVTCIIKLQMDFVFTFKTIDVHCCEVIDELWFTVKYKEMDLLASAFPICYNVELRLHCIVTIMQT